MASDVFKHYLDELGADYRRRLPHKLAELDHLWNDLTIGSAPPARFADLQRELHNLVGTAKTLGLPAVTDAARAAETFLEPFLSQSAPIEPVARGAFKQLLDDLKQAVTGLQDPC
jgi:HPt (histidine-containing phosphotransfer) domain-containing protein